MIYTKTPFRMSFFGGGTDYPPFFREHGGSVIATTFDKYCYVSVRHLPRFFDYRNQLTYSRIEKTKEVLSDSTICTETKVIAAKMSDQAGALKKILAVIQETGVNIEYVYAFTSPVAGSAYVVLRVDDVEGAEKVLASRGIETLTDQDLEGLL